MPLGLLKYGFSRKHPARKIFGRRSELKGSYDIVIIGAGGHGAAIAHYLSKYHGITDIAVIDKGYIGSGNTARNTAVLRSNYLTEEGVNFYKESLALYRSLSSEVDFNVMFEERGQLTLAHTEAAVRSMRWRAEVNQHLGVRSELIGRRQIEELVPLLRMDMDARYPIMAGLWHADGATARHDAVVWGYAKEAVSRGVEFHQLTEAVDVEVDNGRVSAVITNRGRIACGKVVQAVAGTSSVVAAMAGIKLPIHTFPLQAMVTQPYKPLFTPHVSSPQHHVYIHQTSRGELVIGGGSDPYPLYGTRATLPMRETLATSILELFPFLAQAKIMRQWAGITDMTPDYSPIMGLSPVQNYYLDAGWGTWGFKATPISGKTMAETIANDLPPDLIAPFALQRFYEFRQVNEAGATAASH